jgi:hypothetical protein
VDAAAWGNGLNPIFDCPQFRQALGALALQDIFDLLRHVCNAEFLFGISFPKLGGNDLGAVSSLAGGYVRLG